MAIVLPRNFSLVLAEEDGNCLQKISFSTSTMREGAFKITESSTIRCMATDVTEIRHGGRYLPLEWLIASKLLGTYISLTPQEKEEKSGQNRSKVKTSVTDYANIDTASTGCTKTYNSFLELFFCNSLRKKEALLEESGPSSGSLD